MKKFLFTYALLSSLSGAFAQEAKVTFNFHREHLDPPAYSLEIHENCKASYRAERPDVGGERAEPYVKAFQLSPGNCQKVFDLTKALNYFDGDFQFRRRRIAYTGDKTLVYETASAKHQTHFTWSENPSIQQLSALLEGIAATAYWEPKLTHQRRYDKLGLNDSLKAMESQLRVGSLKELELVRPVLQELAGDPQIMNIARERARRLLAAAGPSPAAALQK